MNTPSITTAPEQRSQQDPRELLRVFREKFQVFRDCQPLSIGIDKQLINHDPSVHRKTLRSALGIHTHTSRYLKTMANATQRFNLDGSVASDVPEEHRQHAAKTLRERLRNEATRRRAQREAEALEKQRTENLQQLVKKFSKDN